MAEDLVTLSGVTFEVTSADVVSEEVTCLEFRRSDHPQAAADIVVCQRGDEGSSVAGVSISGALDIEIVEAILAYSRHRLVIPARGSRNSITPRRAERLGVGRGSLGPASCGVSSGQVVARFAREESKRVTNERR